MAESATLHRLPSVEQYLKLEEASAFHHEYVGMIYSYAGDHQATQQDRRQHTVVLATSTLATWS